MKRDILKAAEQGKQILKDRERLQLSMEEVDTLLEDFKANAEDGDNLFDAVFNLIGKTYSAGVAVGMRNK